MKKISSILITVVILMTLGMTSCDEPNITKYTVPEQTSENPLNINADSVYIDGDLGSFIVTKSVKQESDNLQLVTFTFTAYKPSELQPATIKFNFPSIAVIGFWNPTMSIDKVNYYSSGVTSKASRNAPVLSFYNDALQNRITIAISDALNKSEIISYLKEEDVKFYPQIRLFQEKLPKTKSYSITLRIDTRPLPYYESVNDVASWWAVNPNYKPMIIPDDAKTPMYSTWYSYHQNISKDEIVAECKIASSLGCGAVIIDDGWQTNDGNRGYAYTGDWLPERITQMKEFVEEVHNEGMKFILWYSLPFIGKNAKNYPRFKGKYLRHWESQGTYVLDPRYPEVREYIVSTYIKALNDWNLDGFKLDFIGRFTADKKTILTKENGRDYASVNDATDALMTEVTVELTKINPEILIEFRQPYIGPVMRKYGNMFRGVDAPNNAVANKIETTNLRILSQNTAVHSDMFIWRKEENTENAALQILNILYSVPQLSVKLADIPKDHLEMIKYWFTYWNDHKKILIDGKFIPSNPGSNYPILTAINNNHQITTLYEDMVVNCIDNISKLDVINAKSSTKVTFNLTTNTKALVVVKDCRGKKIFSDDVKLNSGINSIEVPKSGILSMVFSD